jgi:hypothetical protein
VVARVLVLLVAVLLVAAPPSHVCAELTGDVMAMASLDEAQPVATTEPPPLRNPAATQPLHTEDIIAPAPACAAIFRPPRAALARA